MVALSRSQDIGSGMSYLGNPDLHATPQRDKVGYFTAVPGSPTTFGSRLLMVGHFSLVVDLTMAQRHLTAKTVLVFTSLPEYYCN